MSKACRAKLRYNQSVAMWSRFKWWLRWVWRVHCAALLLLMLLFGWGTPAKEMAAVREFVEATRRWVVRPEFRAVQVEYVRLGTAATRARIAGLTAGNVMMGMRSVPFLPPSLAANETSQHHYDEFAAGELRAYFRLSEEQGTAWVIEALHDLSDDGEQLSDEQLRGFLLNFKTDEPLVVDEGAVSSLRKLLVDVRPATLPRGTVDVAAQLRAAAAEMAVERELPADVQQLTPAQQADLFGRFDGWVKDRDPDLWRLKQVNDFLNGIWAQTFGLTYARWIGPLVTLWWVARVGSVVWVVTWIGWLMWRRGKRVSA